MKKNTASSEGLPADRAGFGNFKAELARLVAQFEKNFKQYQSAAYDEASVRQEFLNPLFRALGWDVENKLGNIPQHREVEIESRTEVSGRQKRADYLFRTDRQDRFVCEAKKPAEKLHAGYAFQAKRYAWNKGLVLAVLSDFEEIKIYLVGRKPHPDETEAGEWKTWHFLEYAKVAQEMWDLLSRDAVAGGSIERLVAALPRKPAGKTKAKQLWLLKPDRARAIDADFLDFLDEARRGLASDLIRHNDRADLLEGTRLDEAVQRILDRLLFLRICEDRDIDTGRPLANILKVWRDRKDTPLWRDVVAHFRALDHRPASHIPWFNGNLFKEHFSEELEVGDDWISGFLEETSDDESAYLFNVIPVEILGTIYERFLGKTIRPKGIGIELVEKPEVRKAGGVYYTPRYIVDYIVEQTLGKLLEGKSPQESLKLRVLDPACGSGSFLIRAYERLCEHWQIALTKDEKLRRKADCWTDPDTGDVHLTSDLKRRILTATIYGVDLDPGAVEVSQLSLYLKMLEGENRDSLAKNRELFSPDTPLLPPLQNNIKCGNSLIASDFSLNPDDLTRVRAFDWDEGFRDIMKAGGFDVVVGNPPYIRIQTLQESDPSTVKFFKSQYRAATKGNCDIYVLFIEKCLSLINSRGISGFILPNKFLNAEYGAPLRGILAGGKHVKGIVHFGAHQVFDGATTYTCLLFLGQSPTAEFVFHKVDDLRTWETKGVSETAIVQNALLGDTAWSFSVGAGAGLIDRLKSLPIKLGAVADIFVGLQTSADNVFILDYVSETSRLFTLHSKVIGKDVTLEKELLHPLVSGTDVRAYDELPRRQFILFPYVVQNETASLLPWEEMKTKYPRISEYLGEFRVLLSDREKGKFHGADWYRFGRSQNLGIQNRKKVCVPRLVDRLCAAGDLVGSHFLDNVDVGGITWKSDYEKHDFRYLLGLLNSGLLGWFFPNISAPFRGGWMSANRQFLSQLPFRTIDFSNSSDRARHDQLVALVDKMLLLVPKLRSAKSEGDRATLQNAVSATDRAIDALVYELYGLTAEEIALVEGSRV